MANFEDQMDMFEQGGLMDEGGSVDPVSGNDVPTGSTQQEVRDDIPAQLSEGEFVLPADVVRYIGLENIMKMRDMAKEGLQKMEDMGQMGNSEEAIMDDETDFDAEIDQFIENLDTEDEPQEFYVGGLAGMQSTTPEDQAAQIYQQTSGVGFLPPGVTAPGVDANLPEAPMITPGGPGEIPGLPTYETKQYIGPNGEIRTFTFINGKPITPIPEGFALYDPSKIPEATTGVPTATVGGDGGDGPEQTKPNVDPVMGAARAISALNPSRKDGSVGKALDEYDSRMMKVGIGAVASALSGNIAGLAAAAYRGYKANQEFKESVGPTIAENNPTLSAVLGATQNITSMSESDVANSIETGVNMGMSPGLAAAITASGGKISTSPAVTEVDINTGLQSTRQGQTSISGLTGNAESAVQSMYGNSLAQSNPTAYRDMIEEAAFYDATGYGVMSNVTSPVSSATARADSLFDFAVAEEEELKGLTTAPTTYSPRVSSPEAARLGYSAREVDQLASELNVTREQAASMLADRTQQDRSSLTEQALGAARSPSRTVTSQSGYGTRSVSPGESVSFQSDDGRTTNVTGKSYTDASGNTRQGAFVDSNNDGVQQSNERSTVTSSSGSTVTSRDGTPVTSRSQDEIEADTGSTSTDCFMEHTLVTMADGSKKQIKDVVEGDEVLGVYGSVNKVLGAETHEIQAENGYWIVSHDKEVEPFFTVNHPFFHNDELVSFSKDKNDKFNPWLTGLKSAWKYFDSAYQSVAPKGTVLYNLYLDGDYTLYANGFPFHNIVTNGFITMSLYNTGKITQHDLESDVAYTKTVTNPLVRLGYAKVAIPLADEVRKGSMLGKLVSSVCTPFVKGISALSNDKPAPLTKLFGYTFVYPTFMLIGALEQAKGKHS